MRSKYIKSDQKTTKVREKKERYKEGAGNKVLHEKTWGTVMTKMRDKGVCISGWE